MIWGDKITNLTLHTVNLPNINITLHSHGCLSTILWMSLTSSITTGLQDYGAEVDLVVEFISSPKIREQILRRFSVFRRFWVFFQTTWTGSWKHVLYGRRPVWGGNVCRTAHQSIQLQYVESRPSSSNEMNNVSFMLFHEVSHMVYQQWTHSNSQGSSLHIKSHFWEFQPCWCYFLSKAPRGTLVLGV